MKRIRLGLLGALALALLGAAPASAHAQLERTSPSSGAALDTAPKSIVLSFSEPVEAAFGAVRIYDESGDRLPTGRSRHPSGRRHAVTVDLPTLARGSYVVTWRVSSADAHPIHGAFTFRVGAAPEGNTQALVRQLLAAEGGSATVGALYGIARFASFAALVLLIGGGAFVVCLWPDGAGLRPTRRILAAAWIAGVVTTIAGVALHGVYAAALPLAKVVTGTVLDESLSTRFGHASLARLALLALALPLLASVTRGRGRSPIAIGGLAVVGLGLLVSTGLGGHPGADHPVWLGVGLDTLHLSAVSFWLGGLAMLTMALRTREHDLATTVARFSRLAVAAVGVILATGLVQGWRQSRSIEAATGTTYGRLLLIKLGLFAVMVGLAAISRAWVARRAAAADASEVTRLRRSVAGEAAIGVMILAVTALLVNAPPARVALVRPFSTELVTPNMLIDLTVDPAKAGPVDIHVYTLSKSGLVTDVAEMTAQMSLPDKDVGPFAVPLTRAGPGHFSAYGFEVPLRGRWTIVITARTTDIDHTRSTTTVLIR